MRLGMGLEALLAALAGRNVSTQAKEKGEITVKVRQYDVDAPSFGGERILGVGSFINAEGKEQTVSLSMDVVAGLFDVTVFEHAPDGRETKVDAMYCIDLHDLMHQMIHLHEGTTCDHQTNLDEARKRKAAQEGQTS